MGVGVWTFSVENGMVNNEKKNNHLGNLIMPYFCVLMSRGLRGI